jgi:alpha,alpha-trehalase
MRKNKYFLAESLSPLYEDVQKSGIFTDSKYFVDCTPKTSPASILEDYEKNKSDKDFDLKNFVEKHFFEPKKPDANYQTGDKNIADHLHGLWDVLTRKPDEKGGTLIPLPHAYIVPGGRFREIYYWDSYFTMLGLQVSGKVELMENMVKNFAYLIDNHGFIPNGNRTYYHSRSQPPFFSLMVKLLSEEKGDGILKEFLPQMEKEYAFWMDGAAQLNERSKTIKRVVRMANGAVLNRYFDTENSPRPEAYVEDVELAEKAGKNHKETYQHIRAAAESGWDFSSRWFSDGKTMSTIQTTRLLPVDLNCLLLHLEQTLFDIYEKSGDDISKIKKMQAQIKQRKATIQKYFWVPDLEFYTDYQFVTNKNTQQITLAGVMPLFFKIADKKQAESVAAAIGSKFLQAGGLTTTLVNSGQQWDAPNGWAPLQWMTYKGLKNYGFDILAEKIRTNWLATNEKVFNETGKMMEKYNVLDTEFKAGGGEYPNQDGFGWTNGVYLKMKSEA